AEERRQLQRDAGALLQLVDHLDRQHGMAAEREEVLAEVEVAELQQLAPHLRDQGLGRRPGIEGSLGLGGGPRLGPDRLGGGHRAHLLPTRTAATALAGSGLSGATSGAPPDPASAARTRAAVSRTASGSAMPSRRTAATASAQAPARCPLSRSGRW